MHGPKQFLAQRKALCKSAEAAVVVIVTVIIVQPRVTKTNLWVVKNKII